MKGETKKDEEKGKESQEAGPMAMQAYMLITVEAGRAREVLAALKQLPTVRRAHLCFGQPDLICFIEASDNRALGSLILQEIQTLSGVQQTATHIVMED